MKEEINRWIKTQHIWLQEAWKRIVSKKLVDECDIIGFVNTIKDSTVQNTGQEHNDLVDAGKNDVINNIRIVSIGEIQGIENLAPIKPLEFGGENLCVIYGYNGSGKSGYVRILRKTCGKLESGELKCNVFKEQATEQKYTVTYSIDGQEKIISLKATDEPIDCLKPIDIFDNFSSENYLAKGSELAYVPTELVSLQRLIEVCKKVATKLNDEQNLLVKKLPEMPQKFINTQSYGTYQNLSLQTGQLKLNAISCWVQEDADKLKKLEERLKVDDPSIAAKKRREVNKQLDQMIAEIKHALSMIGEENSKKIETLQKVAVERRNAANEGGRILSSKTELNGVGSKTWIALWNAAREYSQSIAYPEKPFPNIEETAYCVLCHQKLNEVAQNRLSVFEKYVQGKLQLDADSAEQEFQNALNSLPKTPDKKFIETVFVAAELSEEMRNKILNLWEIIEKCVAGLKTIANSDAVIDMKLLCNIVNELIRLSETNDAQARQYDEDAQSFDRNKASSELLELQAKQWTSQQNKAISNELVRLEEIKKYREWKKLTDTTQISKKAGEISKVLITEAYIKRFNDELEKLSANNIQVGLENMGTSYGFPLHQIRLKNISETKVEASEILSEGEKKVVSLAAFFADIDQKKTPCIFDDPISSLDRIYEEKTINRLIELSSSRQVLIFTHRLTFLGIINDKANPKNVSIRSETWGVGQPDDVPLFGKSPDNALKNLKNDRLFKAKKVLESEGSEAYYPLAKSLCSDIRILMERIVEKNFLAGIIQRHRREVQTKGKIHNLCKIKKEDCDLVDKIMTKYSCCEHSQSLEAPIELPSPNELEADIDEILSWYDKFVGRNHD